MGDLESAAVVAVVTTCYNQVEFIEKAIQSVADQVTSAKVSQIVVDDGSTDGSLELLRDCEARFDHLRVLSITNRGMAGAFNAGLMALPEDVEYVVIIAGDDWLDGNYVKECLAALTPDVDMVCSAMRRVTQAGVGGYANSRVTPSQSLGPDSPTFEQMWTWDRTYAWGCSLFRREVLIESGGFHPHVGGDCDWDLWVDLIARGYRLAFTDKTCFFYRYSPDSMNRSKTAAHWNAARAEMRRHHHGSTLPGPEFS
jgi:glycosyltransferase involved in cell wall biosynthesis